jgi:CHAT domain-containing protein/lipopolysaccharide biosynthesis regulator YciM
MSSGVGAVRRLEVVALKLACALLFAAIVLGPSVAESTANSHFQAPNPAGQPLPPTAPLLPGKAIDRELRGGERHTYQISLAAGQYADVIVEAKGIDLAVQILNATSSPLDSFHTDDQLEGKVQIGLVAESAGAYQVLVESRYPVDPPAGYSIDLREIRPATQQEQILSRARTLSLQSHTERDAGHYGAALDLAQKALVLGKEALGSDDAYVGELHTGLGAMEFAEGNPEKAAAEFQRAVQIAETAQGASKQQLVSALLGLGNVYVNSNDYPKAGEALERALKITQESQGSDSPAWANCLVAISLLHQHRGEYPRALTELQRALEIERARLKPDDPAIIKAMDSLGDLYYEMHDFDHAVPVLQQTLSLAEQRLGPNHPTVAHPLQNLGIIARRREQYALALEYLWRAEKIRENAFGVEHVAVATLLVNIANVYNTQRDYPRAIETYQRALAILEKTAGPYHEWTLMTLTVLAKAYTAQGDPSHALDYLVRMNQGAETNLALNLAIGSEHERVAYADKLAWHTSVAISFNVAEAPQDPAAADLAALMILQRKGRVVDAVADSMTGLRRSLQPDDQKLLSELSDTTANLAKAALHGPGETPGKEYQEHLDALQSRKERLEVEISRRSAGYYQRPDVVTLSAVRKAIPAGSVLIEFAVYEPYNFRPTRPEEPIIPRYAVYVIPGQGDVRWKDLGEAKQIDDEIDAYRQALRDPQRGDVRQLARALDEKLMQPVRSMGMEARHLIISPDGEQNLLPFEALVDEQGHYLIQNYSISYVTTGRDLLRMQIPRTARSEPVVIANPSFGEPQLAQVADVSAHRDVTTGQGMASVYFAPLAGTAQEARELKSLFPEAKLLTGSQASKRELERVESPTILHIATHGFFLENPPDEGEDKKPVNSTKRNARGIQATLKTDNPLLRSGLALAGANLDKDENEDGILTALEASGLNLWGTKLVTLSACDTGIGEVKNGEGVYGLRRAFIIAGAETVVMSLWPISDAVTRDLMSSYYRGLREGRGRGEALRRAQLAILNRKGHEHPFYWASFIQVGEWANLDGKR